MKILLSCFLLFLFISCSQEDLIEIINDELEEFADSEGQSADSFVTGNFVSDAHITRGTASVNQEKTKLLLNNFKTDSGPKLLVYLSTDALSTDFVNLGDLKGIEGDYEYAIPPNTDLTKYKVVSIWCVDFLVSFGHAELK